MVTDIRLCGSAPHTVGHPASLSATPAGGQEGLYRSLGDRPSNRDPNTDSEDHPSVYSRLVLMCHGWFQRRVLLALCTDEEAT